MTPDEHDPVEYDADDPEAISHAADLAESDAAAAEPLEIPPGVRRALQWIVGLAVPLAFIWFVADSWPKIVNSDWQFTPQILAASAVLYVASELIFPFAWRALMQAIDVRTPIRSLLFVWFATEPTKYLPIPVGPLLGRFALADRVGLDPLPAVVTLVYDYAISIVVTVSIAYPGLIYIVFVLAPKYQWAVWLTGLFLAGLAFLMLRAGGIGRTLSDLLGERGAAAADIVVPRRALVAPAAINFGGFLVRITAAGLLLAALTPVGSLWLAPVYGLVFAAGATMPFSRFGTREAFIVVGLTALGFSTGPVALAAVASRVMGFLATLVLLAFSVVIGGARRAPTPTPDSSGTDTPDEDSSPETRKILPDASPE